MRTTSSCSTSCGSDAATLPGLGLSIATTLVEMLGGSITARVADRKFNATIVLPGTSETNVDSSRAAP